jgi:GH24 family phage-related lysozyme (muramidase)
LARLCGADVASLQDVAVNLVELDEVVVPVEEDRAVGVVVDEVVPDALAHAAYEHGRQRSIRVPGAAKKSI